MREKTTKTYVREWNFKTFHVTIHGVSDETPHRLADLAWIFRPNVQGVVVGLEDNYDQDRDVPKGKHAHVVVQCTTKVRVGRDQLVRHFGSESINVSSPGNYSDLINVLGYAHKCGNTAARGRFYYRSREIDGDPEVMRFLYTVQRPLDAHLYFYEVVEQGCQSNPRIIEEYSRRKDAIGDYLTRHPVLYRFMDKRAHELHLEHRNRCRPGVVIRDFVWDPARLRAEYERYLETYPEVYRRHRRRGARRFVEVDYASHVEHDLRSITDILHSLDEARRYGHARPHKTLNVHVWSVLPGFGKSRLLSSVMDRLVCYTLPDDQYYVDYSNDTYQALVSDEAAAFIQSKTYSHLKSLFEGHGVEFNRKGEHKVFKRDNPLILTADNRSFSAIMREKYPRLYNEEVFRDRVLDLELCSRASLHFLVDLCLSPVGEEN